MFGEKKSMIPLLRQRYYLQRQPSQTQTIARRYYYTLTQKHTWSGTFYLDSLGGQSIQEAHAQGYGACSPGGSTINYIISSAHFPSHMQLLNLYLPRGVSAILARLQVIMTDVEKSVQTQYPFLFCHSDVSLLV